MYCYQRGHIFEDRTKYNLGHVDYTPPETVLYTQDAAIKSVNTL